ATRTGGRPKGTCASAAANGAYLRMRAVAMRLKPGFDAERVELCGECISTSPREARCGRPTPSSAAKKETFHTHGSNRSGSSMAVKVGNSLLAQWIGVLTSLRKGAIVRDRGGRTRSVCRIHRPRCVGRHG